MMASEVKLKSPFICRVKDSTLISDAFNVDPLYLKHENQGKMPDYRVGYRHQNKLYDIFYYFKF